jgi:tryptophan synthase alpha chain
VGFGISTPQHAAEVATLADAVVVGSAISLLVEAHISTGDVLEAVGGLAGAMKDAMRAARQHPISPPAGDSNG